MLLLARVCFKKLWLSVSDVCMGVFLAHLALYTYTLLSRSVITQLLFNYKYNVSFVYFIVHTCTNTLIFLFVFRRMSDTLLC